MSRSVLRRAAERAASEALRVVHPLERFALSRVPTAERIAPPPVFLVGAPRCGSTVLSQVLINYFDVTYTSNLSGLFYHSLYLGTRVHGALLGGGAFNRFDSRHGRTDGLREPSECGKFWYRWFPSDRHFVAEGELSPSQLAGMRETFAAIARHTGRPMFIKNLNCGQRLQVLRQVLPEALVIFLRRDPLETAASILAGRVEANGDKDAWWSVMPRSVEELRSLTYPEQIARQVFDLERQIESDLSRFPERQVLRMHYDEVCSDTAAAVERVRGLLEDNGAAPGIRAGAVLPQVRKSSGARVDPSDLELLRREIERLPW